MKKDKRNESSLQNKFTAYLMAAVKNTRITYMDKKKKVRKSESSSAAALVKGHTDFEQEYHRYLCENSLFNQEMNLNVERLVRALDEKKLVKALLELKKREQEILLARLFGEQDFSDIGQAHGLTAKQAEMSYYYIIRKLRKKLEGKLYE